MNSEMDVTVHHVDPAQEAVRPRKLSEKDQKKHKKRRSGRKKPVAGEVFHGDQENADADAKAKPDDDHLVDYYA